MSKIKTKTLSEVDGLALQIVFEYPDWSGEHIEEMLALYEEEDGDEIPTSYDELYDRCNLVAKLKTEFGTYKLVEAALLKS